MTLNAGDDFGQALAMNAAGNILAVGAYEDDTGGTDKGAVYLFSLNPLDLTIAPTFRQKIVDGTSGIALAQSDGFGVSVALNGSGDVLAVGAYQDDIGATDQGAAYVFSLNTSNLETQASLNYKISSGLQGLQLNSQDNFGIRVSLKDNGNLLAVGAHRDDTGGDGIGSVYLFSLDPSDPGKFPTLRYKLAQGSIGVTLGDYAGFGSGIALNGAGDILAIGAYTDNTGGTRRGAVYLFTLNPGNLDQAPVFQYKLAHGSADINLNNGDGFGVSVALNGAGDILAVGALFDDTGGTDRGAVYLFNLNPVNLMAAPSYRSKLAHGVSGLNLLNSDRFGDDVALNGLGNILAVGGWFDDTAATDAGAVYLFQLDPNNLSAATPVSMKYTPANLLGWSLRDSDRIGHGVALNAAGDMLAVGAYNDDTGGANRGAVYLFNLNPANLTVAPTYRYKLAHGSPGVTLADSDQFGVGVALNAAGDMLAVGARGDDTGGTDRGAVYLFNLNPANLTVAPTYRYKLAHGSPGLTLADYDLFGLSVALNAAGDMLAVGVEIDDTGGTDRGAAYLFNLNPANLTVAPTYRYKLAHGSPGLTLADSDRFGRSVALNAAGDMLAVGAAQDDTGGTDRGAAYLFNLNPANLTVAPTYRYKLAHGSPGLTLANSDNFGVSVALNGAGDMLAVGASGDDTGGTNRGAAYLFNLNPANLTVAPTYRYKLAHGSPGLTLANSDNFGVSVALNGAGDMLAVGAFGDDTGGTDRGAVYLFNLNPTDLTASTTSLRNKVAHGTAGFVINDSDLFGISTALNDAGDILAVGAFGDDTGGGDRGAVYLFTLNPADVTVAPSFRLKINHGTAGISLANSDLFGYGISLNGTGNILAVGAWGDDTGGTERGAAYLFNLDATDLGKAPLYRRKIAHGTSTLTLANTDYFGGSLALNGAGDILAIGAERDDTGGTDRGAVYLWSLNTADLTAVPTLQRKIASGTSTLTLVNSDYFGRSVALNGAGDILAVGTFFDDTGGTDRGAVYLWSLNTGSLSGIPTLQRKIASATGGGPTLVNSDYFGRSVALNAAGDLLVVGAQADYTGGTDRGAVHVFSLNPASLASNATYRQKINHGTSGLVLQNSDYCLVRGWLKTLAFRRREE